jgi:hypothetical protein
MSILLAIARLKAKSIVLISCLKREGRDKDIVIMLLKVYIQSQTLTLSSMLKTLFLFSLLTVRSK